MVLASIIRDLIFICALLVAGIPAARAADLAEIFQLALKNDPLLSSADFLRYAAQGDKDQACGQLLPQITIPGSFITYDQEEAGSVIGQDSTSTNGALNGDQASLGVVLSQTLFNAPKFTACRMGRIRVNQGNAGYELGLEDLIYRVINTYINVLSAQNELTTVKKAVELQTLQLEDAMRGAAAETVPQREVDDAVARLKLALADRKTAENELVVARERLGAIVNEKISLEYLARFREGIPLALPEPADPEHWVEIAEKENLRLVESLLAVEAMQYGMKSAYAEMWPSVGLFAHHTEFENDIERSGASLDSDDGDFSVEAFGVAMTWPLFTGGSNKAAASAATNRYKAARDRHEALRREVGIDTRKAVLGLEAGQAHIEAAEAVLVAAQSHLHAMEKGVKAGTNTKTDLLEARLRLLEAENGAAAARYGFAMGMVDFWKTIGALSAASVEEINRWLVYKE